MIPKLLIGKQVKGFSIEEYSCSLTITDGYSISIGCLCRFIGSDQSFLSAKDHKQLFGLPAPFDAAGEIQKQIGGQKINNVILHENTADLTLFFDSGRLEIICDSSGYECYQIYGPENLIIVGRGGG
jgi:hypothetical protein